MFFEKSNAVANESDTSRVRGGSGTGCGSVWGAACAIFVSLIWRCPWSPTASARAAELALAQYSQGASDYTRVLNTQTSLLAQQDTLTAARGQVVSNLVATYKALGGGWQLREGNNYVSPDLINSMEIRTDWGELLNTPE